ncbi:AFG1-like ATPase-domain-containing protein [Roridomyces roridus]|uniref:AFG1-like ATPase-domain-containing protein n=1 Tax=Roridomyces roridus TaxID=1738132 RepID=A0AAD7CEJ3_9AGAR|nr:AFG1-like ATPase-domain-containing protein [Roridomyces roridus]
MLTRVPRLHIRLGRPFSTALSHTDLLEKYRALVTAGHIKHDEEQVRVIMQLRRLQKELVDYSPASIAPHLLESPETSSSAWYKSTSEDDESADSRALVSLKSHAEELAALNTAKGILLTGPPGSGKSFLVDLWLACIPTPYKTRKHYSQLVLEIYRGVWEETQRRMSSDSTNSRDLGESAPWNASVRDQWRDLLKSGNLPLLWRSRARTTALSRPTIAFSVARRLVLRHWLLVFDEIQLLDISSATLLADVLSWYWRMGGVIVGTSNKVPDEIYKHGVQRERLEPFVEALKVRCPVLSMRSEHDWRRQDHRQEGRTWLLHSDEGRFVPLLKSFTSGEAEQMARNLHVFGRHLQVPWSSGGVAQFTFAELCDASLGPADYFTLAAHFHTIGISNIPVLPLSAKNQARRFISLIDALYEARCRVVCLAETKPEELFFPDAQASLPEEDVDAMMMAESISEGREGYRPNVSAYDSPGMAGRMEVKPLALDTLSIFSGQEEQFAFKRALSRLIEMTSPAYIQGARWTPLSDGERAWEKNVTQTRESVGHDEFASEETYLSETGIRRPAAPRIKADHVWGVREDWGPAAGKWGKGADTKP